MEYAKTIKIDFVWRDKMEVDNLYKQQEIDSLAWALGRTFCQQNALGQCGNTKAEGCRKLFPIRRKFTIFLI